jgi:hypothetical protein
LRGTGSVPDGEKSRKRAFRFVTGMALAISIVVSICVLIWWFAGDHSFDILGRTINIAGFILIVFSMIALVNLKGAVSRKRMITVTGEKHKLIDRHKPFPGERPGDLPLILFFGGSGLLCLFIGSMIIIGLQ